MNSAKFFYNCCRVFKFQYFTKLKPLNYSTSMTLLKNTTIPSMLLGASFFMVKQEPGKKEEKIPINYVTQIKKDCIGSEKKINELIMTLEEAITESCEKYRACLSKQYDILEKGVNLDPLDQYWDSLVPLRVEANNLKRDFESYRGMVEYVGQLAFNLAFCSALMSNLDMKDYVCEEYFKLEKIAKEQIVENKKMEEKLLERNMTNILNTSNTAKDIKDIASELKKNIDNMMQHQEKQVRNKIISE